MRNRKPMDHMVFWWMYWPEHRTVLSTKFNEIKYIFTKLKVLVSRYTSPGEVSKFLVSANNKRTHSVDQSQIREVNICSVAREIPITLWNPKVYYYFHKTLSQVPVHCQINPVHTQIHDVHMPCLSHWFDILIISGEEYKLNLWIFTLWNFLQPPVLRGIYIYTSLDSSVSITTGYGMDGRGSIRGRGK
jgi:hypothetical protein